MDRAFNVVTKTVEFAKQINEEYPADYINLHKKNFACINELCRYDATPCSFGKKPNGEDYKVKAYFRFNDHEKDCCFSEANGCKKISNGDGSFRYVVAHVHEILVPANPKKQAVSLIPPSECHSNIRAGGKSSRASSSLAAAVIFYIQNPKANAYLPLTVNGIKRTYRSFFQSIINKPGARYKAGFIFYRVIKYSIPARYEGNLIKITLFQKCSETGELCELWIDRTHWTERNKRLIDVEIESRYKQGKSKKSNHTVTAFFIGAQDPIRKNIFHCSFAQYIHLYYGEYFKLEWNNHGIEKIKVPVTAQEPSPIKQEPSPIKQEPSPVKQIQKPEIPSRLLSPKLNAPLASESSLKEESNVSLTPSQDKTSISKPLPLKSSKLKEITESMIKWAKKRLGSITQV